MKRLCLVLVLGSFLATIAALTTPSFAAEPRPAWTTSRFAGTPDPPPPYRVEPAFGGLTFKRPLDVACAPGSNRLFVAEHEGKIYSFVNDAKLAKADLLVDLKQVYKDLTAIYGMTFHPRFERNRFVYVCFVKANDKPDGSIVSRFEVSRDDPPTLDPASEKVILRWWSGGHNGGCLKFGPDGCLYISTGDGSGPNPPDSRRAGQDVTNLTSAILRIDVDRAEGKEGYRVPLDNPLLKIEGARPEIWAYGFRNPWKMSFDRVGGDLWVGDVGWQLWEMIYRVEKGGNYGWSIVEGPQSVLPEEKRGPTPILPPAVSHPHSEAASITGGYVYRGSLLPELVGAYIYGDFQTGKVWGLRHDGKQVTWHKELAQTPLTLVAFGEDQAGELYLLDYERSQTLHRLVKNPDTKPSAGFPRQLSQTGLFSSVADQTPAPGVTPYSINAPQWADHATSERWIALPGNEPVQMEAQGNWKFPEGAVLAKTISMELERGVPATRRRLETQILHSEQGSWRPYTYRWNEEQTDAELVGASGASQVLKIRDAAAPAGLREPAYRFASRAECLLCHNPWIEKKTTMYGVQTASPLGVSVLQWNRPASVEKESENQLAQFVRQGVLAESISKDLAMAPRLVDPYDAAANLNDRARSYLHVNCGHCHQHHAGGTAMIDLAYEAKPQDARTVDVRPMQGAFGISDARIIAPADPLGSVLHYRMSKLGGGRMPRIGSDEVDERGVALIHDWIANLPRSNETEVPAVRKADEAALAALRADSPETRTKALGHLISSTRGALALARAVERKDLPQAGRDEAIALASEHSQSEVRDLFERFVPASKRLVRLGSAVNTTDLLALPGNAERGRKLFFREGAVSCKSCHKVNGEGESLGPELSQIGKKYPPQEMLTHLLEPSKFMEPKYVPHLLETAGGEVLSGLLVEKSDREVVLRTAQNKELRVPAQDVERLVPQQKSLMPDLLLRDLTPQQAADLLAYLVSLR